MIERSVCSVPCTHQYRPTIEPTFPILHRTYNLFVYFCSIDQSLPNANAALRSREAISAEYRCARVFSLRPLPASMWIEIAFQPNRGEPTLSHSIRCRVSRRPSGPLPAPLYPFRDLPTYLLPHLAVKSEIPRQFALETRDEFDNE